MSVVANEQRISLQDALQGDLSAGKDILPTLRRVHVLARDFKLPERYEVTLLSAKFTRLGARRQRELIGEDEYQAGVGEIRGAARKLIEAIFRHETVGYREIFVPAPQESETSVVLEAMLSESDAMVDINWLYVGYQLRRAVCHIKLSDPPDQGTGFFCELGSWTGIVTCHHVIGSSNAAKTATISFDQESSVNGPDRVTYDLDPASWRRAPGDMDVCLVSIKGSPVNLPPPLRFCPSASPKINDRVSIIQHPLGDQKKIALGNNRVLEVDDCFLYYTTATQRGSSGSPVFDEMWRLIGVHRGSRESQNRPGVITANLGIAGRAILRALGGMP